MSKPCALVTDPLFSVSVTPEAGFVEIVMRGFWTIADFQRFETALRAAMPTIAAKACPIGEQVTLFDVTDYSVQSADVLTGLARMAGDATIASRRVAVLLSSTLLKMQARRAAPGYALFEERVAAMTWLFDADDTRSPPASG